MQKVEREFVMAGVDVFDDQDENRTSELARIEQALDVQAAKIDRVEDAWRHLPDYAVFGEAVNRAVWEHINKLRTQQRKNRALLVKFTRMVRTLDITP